jgi:hypothetical protein
VLGLPEHCSALVGALEPAWAAASSSCVMSDGDDDDDGDELCWVALDAWVRIRDDCRSVVRIERLQAQELG